jgi:hypothetical protein
MGEKFSVHQFFAGGSHEEVGRDLSAERAMQLTRQCCTSVGARVGTTIRVILVDDGEAVNMEWKHTEGITFPPELVGREFAV